MFPAGLSDIMLTISKPTLFNPDGLAARGQCNHDSPGWQLRWFDRQTPPVLVWQGAFKTCRHLQTSCVSATTLDEVKAQVEDLLNANAPTHFASQPTDAYPSANREDDSDRDTEESTGGPPRKKRKKRRHS